MALDENSEGYCILIYVVVFVGYPILVGFIDWCNICCIDNKVNSLGYQAQNQVLKDLEEKKKSCNEGTFKNDIDIESYSPNSKDDVVVKNSNNFNKDFLKELLTDRCYYNTYIPSGDNSNPTLTQVMRSDSLFVFLNTNALVSPFCALKGHEYSRYERRMAFVTQHGLALLLSVVAVAAFNDNVGAGILFNILIVSPLTILVNSSFYLITACPCLSGEYKNCCFACIARILKSLGTFFAHFYALNSIIFLIIAALLAYYSGDKLIALTKYATDVFVVSTGVSIIMHIIKIHVFMHVSVKICGFVLFDGIGRWYKEYLLYNHKDKGQDYEVANIGCILKIELWYPVHGHSKVDDIKTDPIVLGGGDVQMVATQECGDVQMVATQEYQLINNSNDNSNNDNEDQEPAIVATSNGTSNQD